MDEEAKKLTDRVSQRTLALLTEKRHFVELVAERLLQREVLKYDDLVELVGPRYLWREKKLAHNPRDKRPWGIPTPPKATEEPPKKADAPPS